MRALVTGAGGYIANALLPAINNPWLDGKSAVHATACPRNNYSHELGAFSALIHLAADTAGDWQANVYGTADAVRNLPTGARFIFASSLSAQSPLDQYDREKSLGEQIVQARPDIEAVILRLGCVYGPGKQNQRSALNSILRQAHRGEQISLYGNAHGARDLVYIDDVVAAFVAALTAPPGAYDVGTASSTTLSRAAAMAVEEAGGTQWPVTDPMTGSVHLPIARESRFLPGWAPRVTLREGIRQTIAWLREHEPAREMVAS